MNNSPRLYQLNDRQPYPSLEQNISTDVAIIGGGIAGIMTAYFLLKETNRSVSLFEATMIGHGATGHNAGQVTPYFEKRRDEIVTEYGLDKAVDAQKSVFHAWDLLMQIFADTGCDVPFHECIGYAGCSTDEQILEHLTKKSLREQGHIGFDSIAILDSHPRLVEWQTSFPGIFETISAEKIQELLQTTSDIFTCVLSCRKGVINSSKLCEFLHVRMSKKYGEKIHFYEQTPIAQMHVYADHIAVQTAFGKTAIAKQAILCTNGFENFTISDHTKILPDEIDIKIHDAIHGVVGYMSGYTTQEVIDPIAISYFLKPGTIKGATAYQPYYYLTARPFIFDSKAVSLISVGGPEDKLIQAIYDRTADQPQQAHDENAGFLHHFSAHPITEQENHFRRHGLMGYTSTGIRMIGPFPSSPHVYCNLGCNGVGIMLSTYGGWKVAKMIGGEKFPESVFDVQ